MVDKRRTSDIIIPNSYDRGAIFISKRRFGTGIPALKGEIAEVLLRCLAGKDRDVREYLPYCHIMWSAIMSIYKFPHLCGVNES